MYACDQQSLLVHTFPTVPGPLHLPHLMGMRRKGNIEGGGKEEEESSVQKWNNQFHSSSKYFYLPLAYKQQMFVQLTCKHSACVPAGLRRLASSSASTFFSFSCPKTGQIYLKGFLVGGSMGIGEMCSCGGTDGLEVWA